MKRVFCVLLTILLLSSFFVSSVSAAETEEYSVEISLITRESDKPDIPYIAYFRNTATGEIIGFYLNPTGYNSFPVKNLTPGDYEFEKLVLANKKSLEYGATGEVKILQIVEDNYTFYTLKVSATGTEMGDNADKEFLSATVLRPIVDKSNDPESNPLFWILLCGLFVPVTLALLLWIINAIRARKNFYRYFVAKLYKHITIAIFSFMLACAFAGNSELPSLLVIPFCTGFPFGVIAVATFGASYAGLPTEQEIRDGVYARDYRSKDENAMIDSAMGCGAVILGLLCGIVGVIALPIVLVKDIKNIKKYKYLDRKIR